MILSATCLRHPVHMHLLLEFARCPAASSFFSQLTTAVLLYITLAEVVAQIAIHGSGEARQRGQSATGGVRGAL